MKNKLIAIIIFCSFKLSVLAQTTSWNKDDRNNIYEDCISYVSKFKSLTQDQRESISLCYLDEITKKYNKSEYSSKIDIELKRIKDAQLTQCAKNIGVELSNQSKAEVAQNDDVVESNNSERTSELKRENLIGKWKLDNNATIEFKKDGTYAWLNLYDKPMDNGYYIKDKLIYGDWFLDEKARTVKLSVKYTGELWNKRLTKIIDSINYYEAEGRKYKFGDFSKDYLKIERMNKNGVSETIQGNRIEE